MGIILFIMIIALCSGPRRPMCYRPMGFGFYRRPMHMHHHHHHGPMRHGPRGFGPRGPMGGHRF